MLHRFRPAFGRLTAAVITWLMFFAVGIFADSYPRQFAVDIQNYVFKLELRDDSNEIAGETQIDLLFKADGITELFLDLVGRSSDGKTGMSVSSIKGNDQTLTFKHENNRIQTVHLDQLNHTFVFKLDKEPVNVVLDPNIWLLMQLGSFSKK